MKALQYISRMLIFHCISLLLALSLHCFNEMKFCHSLLHSAVFSVHCCFSAGCRISHCTLTQCAVDCSVQCAEHLTLSWTLIFHSTDLSSWPTFQWLSSFSCTLHISKTKVIHKYLNTRINKYINTQIHKCKNTQIHKYKKRKYFTPQISHLNLHWLCSSWCTFHCLSSPNSPLYYRV